MRELKMAKQIHFTLSAVYLYLFVCYIIFFLFFFYRISIVRSPILEKILFFKSCWHVFSQPSHANMCITLQMIGNMKFYRASIGILLDNAIYDLVFNPEKSPRISWRRTSWKQCEDDRGVRFGKFAVCKTWFGCNLNLVQGIHSITTQTAPNTGALVIILNMFL